LTYEAGKLYSHLSQQALKVPDNKGQRLYLTPAPLLTTRSSLGEGSRCGSVRLKYACFSRRGFKTPDARGELYFYSSLGFSSVAVFWGLDSGVIAVCTPGTKQDTKGGRIAFLDGGEKCIELGFHKPLLSVEKSPSVELLHCPVFCSLYPVPCKAGHG